MHIDALHISAGLDLHFDLCVIGAGPAGISIARRLNGSGLRVALLESGGFRQTVRTQHLNDGNIDGRPYWPLESSRFRLFGGSGNRWAGMCRPLDRIDFQAREWVPDSGWPIAYDELARYYPDAAEVLGFTDACFDIDAWPGRVTPAGPIAGADFDNAIYRFSPTKLSFGEAFRAEIVDSPGITLITNATVTDLALASGTDRVEEAVVRTFGGGRFSIQARTFVLASGGIENARLLLASRSNRPAGLGNENDQVGRYFMEHIHGDVGHLVVPRNQLDLSFFDWADVRGLGRVRGVLAGSPRVQREGELLGASVAVEPPMHPVSQPFLSWSPEATVYPERFMRRLFELTSRPPKLGPTPGEATLPHNPRARDLLAKTWYRATSAPGRRAVASLRARNGGDDMDIFALFVRAEQTPNPSSRVTLDPDRSAIDALGMPKVRLDWQVNERDFESVESWVRRLRDGVAAGGVGTVVAADESWRAKAIGGPHHIGTTRMSADARHGVVDTDARVHSLANLYVAGCSVFPTGGYVNPTLSLVAQSLRLADHLAARARQPVAVRTSYVAHRPVEVHHRQSLSESVQAQLD